MIRVSVSLANASVTETETLTAGRVGLECGFTFSSEWDDLAKVAVFEGAETIEVALGTASVAVVPPECMATAGYNLRVGVYGLSASTAIVIPTIWAKAGKIKDSAAPDDESLAPATPELVAQIIEKSDTALMLAQNVAEQAESGAFIGEPGVSPTISSSVIENGHRVTITDAEGDHAFNVMNGPAYTLTEEDKAEIVADVVNEIPLVDPDAKTSAQTQPVGVDANGKLWTAPGGTTDYDQLSNRPSINGHTLAGNQTAAQLGLATPSDIPAVPVQSVNGQTGAVVLSASDVGALPSDADIPTKTSDLTNDSGFVNASGAAAAAPVQSVNGKTGAVVLNAADVGAGTYSKPSGGIPASDLAAGVIPTVPTNVSAFSNDAGYLTLATLPVYNGGVT